MQAEPDGVTDVMLGTGLTVRTAIALVTDGAQAPLTITSYCPASAGCADGIV